MSTTPKNYTIEHFLKILQDAYNFTCSGKGAERHGSGDITVSPLETQPWVNLTEKTKGLFPLGQACKKSMEAMDLEEPERKLKEIWGAISYLCFTAMYLEKIMSK